MLELEDVLPLEDLLELEDVLETEEDVLETDDVLELMGTSLYTLNLKVHTADSREEMAHAVNYIKITTLKTKWQALFKFLYGTNSEDVEFGNQS